MVDIPQGAEKQGNIRIYAHWTGEGRRRVNCGRADGQTREKRGSVCTNMALEFRHLATYSHPVCVSTQLVPGVIKPSDRTSVSNKGRTGQKELLVSKKVFVRGVETYKRATLDM